MKFYVITKNNMLFEIKEFNDEKLASEYAGNRHFGLMDEFPETTSTVVKFICKYSTSKEEKND